MWRGYHKFSSQEEFDQLAAYPSSFPVCSSAGTVKVEDDKYCIVIDDVFPHSMCEEIARMAEDAGYQQALLNNGEDKQEQGKLNELVRKGSRAIIESRDLADRLWLALELLMPPRDVVPGKRYAKWRATGVNPTLRILKYTPGDYFELHQDGSYSYTEETGQKRRSFLTLQVYLNGGGEVDFKGGATRIFSSIAPIPVVHDVVPRTGRVLLFQHNVWHIGEEVLEGTKLVLRTEVMFTEDE